MAQNVGINNTDPKLSLDVNGGFAHRSVTIDPYLNNVVIPVDISYVIITNVDVTGPITIFAPEFIDGRRLVIENKSIYTATFGTTQILQNEIKEFIGRDPGGYVLLSTSIAPSWKLSGNAGTNPATHFIGTTDAQPLHFKVSNSKAGVIDLNGNTGFGNKALSNFSPTSVENTAVGQFSMFSLEEGEQNTSFGNKAMFEHKTGSRNVAIGAFALEKGINNDKIVAIGYEALLHNDGKSGNTAVGTASLRQNGHTNSSPILTAQAKDNTAVGSAALINNARGSGAVAIGSNAAYSDTMAHGIIAIGRNALFNNLSGRNNLAIGDSSLFKTGIGVTNSFYGNSNMGIGKNTLMNNTEGSGNLAIGNFALQKSVSNNGNMAIGSYALLNLTSGFSNVAVGSSSLGSLVNGYDNVALSSLVYLSNGSENIGIGRLGIVAAKASKNILIGNAGTVWTSLTDTISSNVLVGYRNAVSMNGHKNVLIGNNSGGVEVFGTANSTLGDSSLVSNKLGNNNVALGAKSGAANINGSGNVFLGFRAGAPETSSNKLYIENTNADKNNSLIYGDFSADSLLLNGKTIVRNNAIVRGYTKLGGYESSVPAVKMKKIINTGPATNASKLIAHGLMASKILGVEIFMEWAGEGNPASPSRVVPPNFTTVIGLHYQYEIMDNNIKIYNIASGDIAGQALRILITYEE